MARQNAIGKRMARISLDFVTADARVTASIRTWLARNILMAFCRRYLSASYALITLCLLAGCAGNPSDNSWGGNARWPSGEHLGTALRTAALDPVTWAPLAGAALLGVGDLDDEVTDWAIDETPLFGEDATGRSDDLRDLLGVGYVLTAVIAPSDVLGDKARGLGVGLLSFALEGAVSEGLKELSSRDRPDGSNDRSFPSGHATNSAARAYLIRRNLAAIDMPEWARTSLNTAAYTMAASGSFARVEGGKHHMSDALAGFALGNFIARFVSEAFLPGESGVRLSATPLSGGAAMSVTLPLR